MKIILFTTRFYDWPDEVKGMYDVDSNSRVDQKLIELIEKRKPQTNENEEFLLREYAAATGNLDLTDRAVLAEFLKGAKRYLSDEFYKYNSFKIKNVPDEATYVTIQTDRDGFETLIYMLDGQLYYDGEKLPNYIQDGNNGGKV